MIWRKKHQSHQTRLLKKVMTLFNRSGSKRAEPPQIHNQYLQSQALVSPWSHFLFRFIVYYYEAPEQAENHP